MEEQAKKSMIKEDFLHSASSYLRITEDNLVLTKGNFHSYCKVAPDFDEKKVTKKPSFLRKLYHTFF